MDTIKINKKQALMVAHRGASAMEKENTLAAFIAAGNRSYFGIETDVHRTLDGKFICFHDDTTKRVAIDDMVVEQTTFETLRSLLLTDLDGQKGRVDLHMPTLQEYIRTCKKYEKIAVLELKNAFEVDDLAKIVYTIREEGYLENVIFISFCLDNMLNIRKMLPTQPCQYLISRQEIDEGMIALLKDNNLDLDIRYTLLNEENIAKLHENGIKVNCWTVDEKADAEQLAAWGVDFITSNRLE